MKNIFGLKIRELRKGKKLNQAQMAEILGVHLQTVCRYETGKLTPSPDVLSVLAEKFDVDVNWLFSEGQVPIVGESAVGYSVLSDLEESLLRIIKEGDAAKLAAVKAVLELADPGRKAK